MLQKEGRTFVPLRVSNNRKGIKCFRIRVLSYDGISIPFYFVIQMQSRICLSLSHLFFLCVCVCVVCVRACVMCVLWGEGWVVGVGVVACVIQIYAITML